MNTPAVKYSNNEGRVLTGLILILILIECGMRFYENKISGNIAHIFSIPEITNTLSASEYKNTLIFMGNSLTNNAIDADLIAKEFAKTPNTPNHILKLVPDGTSLSDWYCIYQNQLNKQNQHPSYLIIGFAWGQLSDQYPINPTRLGGFLCEIDDIYSLTDTGLTKHQQLLRFLAGKTSHVFVNKEAIRNQILAFLIPNYQSITQNENRNKQKPTSKETKEYTFNLLKRFIRTIEKTQTQIILVAMPVIKAYEIDKDLITLTNNLQVPILDMRQPVGLSVNMFKDYIHLNTKGKEHFSQEIIEKIRPYLDKKTKNTINKD